MTRVGPRPFAASERAAGVLLHVTSLPSRHGIGDLGPAAVHWIDCLHAAGLAWWQTLPFGPTGWGDSPYQSPSSFAGNPLLLSPDRLVEDGLLRLDDLDQRYFPSLTVDFGSVAPFKRWALETARARLRTARPDLVGPFEEFCHAQAGWLDDHALFQALKARHGGRHYLEWPRELIERQPAALAAARRELAGEIDHACFAQFLLARQAAALRTHAAARGVGLIGDVPFFVSPDSSDVWAHPELFLLDEARRPRAVAGVPPDVFAVDGQLWGNPVYDWDALRATGYRWWIERIQAVLAQVDLVRLDHFRAFAAAWHVPAGAPTAREGEWTAGPGPALFETLARELGGLPFVVEDLGLITPDVIELRERFGLPGTRVLQFGFDGDRDNPHLPHRYPPATVAYTGTHDNPTTRGWYEMLGEAERRELWRYVGRFSGDAREAVAAALALVWSSPAALAIAPFQDVLALGDEARMNVPGRAEGNWRWRCTADTLRPEAFAALRDLTRASGRQARAREELAGLKTRSAAAASAAPPAASS
jgi:4-alpha-glucanotransferase